MIDLKQIKPKKRGVSDKYSWQLYRYFEKKKISINHVRVIYDTQSWWDGHKIEFDNNKVDTTQVWIGFVGSDKWLMGNRLNSILGCSKNRYTMWANPWIMQHEHIDITDWFWNEYIKSGRCIWDRSHDGWLTEDKERFTYIDENTRVCNWCGLEQKKSVEEKVEVKKIETWN